MTDPAPDGDPAIDPDAQRRRVRERYAGIAADAGSCCGPADGCCGDVPSAEDVARLGYASDDVDGAAGAELSLGCGNPIAIAALEPGETVVDLGSGGGFDCFLAAEAVGEGGDVIGVDMTPEMVETARTNAERNGAGNVEFRLGEIEHLPVRDGGADVVISNCVINLSPDKPQVFREAFRVLRSGGRLAVSDVVQTAPLPPDVRDDPDALAACVAGASRIADLERHLDDAGFVDVRIEPVEDSAEFIREWDEERDLDDYLVSARIEARKQAGGERDDRAN